MKNALGVTVNDVVLAITAGALRNYLDRPRRAARPPLVAAIPTIVRADGEREFGNRVSRCSRRCPVEIERPARARRSGRSARSSGAKQVHEVVGSSTLQDWAGVAAPAVFSRAMRAVRPAAAR